MNVPLLDLKKQFAAIEDEAVAAVTDVLRGAHYIMGENVKAFEAEFAADTHSRFGISVGNGTDALVIALLALGIGEGDEVITTPYTFFATAESISAVGATPVFADVDPRTYNLDPQKLEAAVTPRTRAILPVHLFGQCADMEGILAVARRHRLKVVEDACQAVGAQQNGRPAGAWGDLACFSFFPTKNLGCAGDGGMIVTNDETLAVTARALRAHGSGENGQRAYAALHPGTAEAVERDEDDNTVYNARKYYNYLIGRNSRLDEIQAALLRVKRAHLAQYTAGRQRVAAAYNAALAGTGYTLPYVAPGQQSVWHQYVLQHPRRDAVCAYLKEKGVATGIYYPVPVHLQKVYEPLGWREGDLPVAEALSRRMFALPISPELTQEELAYVIACLKEADR
ncbi:MAG: DegT/DnrJ/EryC1/StrS family aminotransferase [Eubacteriales bacterium]|nr:DegT/DnrJ/EryC1/StrS family aminotransferase [Eubacteriales bacterium]